MHHAIFRSEIFTKMGQLTSFFSRRTRKFEYFAKIKKFREVFFWGNAIFCKLFCEETKWKFSRKFENFMNFYLRKYEISQNFRENEVKIWVKNRFFTPSFLYRVKVLFPCFFVTTHKYNPPPGFKVARPLNSRITFLQLPSRISILNIHRYVVYWGWGEELGRS